MNNELNLITIRRVWETDTGETWKFMAISDKEPTAYWGNTPLEALEKLLNV